MGLPWWSSGYDSALPLQGAWVRSLVGEIRSCIPCGVAKGKKKKVKNGLNIRHETTNIYHGILFSYKKEENPAICDNMVGP